MEEVKRGVWGCDGSKCPGPDGFNFKFYRLAWDFIAQDILDIVLSFFRTGRLPKGINTTYVTLLSKTVEPIEFKDFRPISMIHGIYKIIAKILASRLKTVMQEIISINQSAIITDRNIIDGFMIAVARVRRRGDRPPSRKNRNIYSWQIWRETRNSCLYK